MFWQFNPINQLVDLSYCQKILVINIYNLKIKFNLALPINFDWLE